jgi:multidrug resistance efflux pump
MKRTGMLVILLLLVIALGAGAYFGGFLDPLLPASITAQPAAAPLDQETVENAAPETEELAALDEIIVDARVLPAREAELSLPVGGIVSELLVDEGDTVEQGQVLLRLNDAQAQTAVARTQAELQRAQAQLSQLLAGARTQEIEAAEATLAAAQARLERLRTGAMPGDMAVAEAQIDAAQAGLAKVLEGTPEQQIIAARADLANAEAELQRAQRAYNDVKWRNDVGATPEAAQLQVATNNWEAAKARLADLQTGATSADVAGAQAQVRQAQANRDRLELTYPAEIAAAEAEVRQAEAQLELLLAGARTEEIASAEADVAAATASLQQALVNLADLELRAPFTGAVAFLELEEGEQISAGAALLQLADLNEWVVYTEDLTELDIIGIEPGTGTTLTFDAIPDLAIPGTVTRVRPIGGDLRGDIVYTVVIEPGRSDDRLRWNMTAVATFPTE